jgi:hypothetical protein
VARLSILVALGASLLAAGCCCPSISGRYYEVGLPSPSCACDDRGSTPSKFGPAAGHGTASRTFGGWFGKGENGDVASQQHADYVSPLAQFHPAPTRPVFEPQLYHAPPLALDPVAKPLPPAGKL